MSNTHCLLIVATFLLTGCAGWRDQLTPQPNIANDREARKAAALYSFELHRDAMQLQAALDRFDQGDYTGCESRLATLVERRPDFVTARLRLAEIIWSRGDAASAEQHYLAALSLHSDLAEAHHGLGMLLEAEGRFDEAADHLTRAAEFQPDRLPLIDAEGRRLGED